MLPDSLPVVNSGRVELGRGFRHSLVQCSSHSPVAANFNSKASEQTNLFKHGSFFHFQVRPDVILQRGPVVPRRGKILSSGDIFDVTKVAA